MDSAKCENKLPRNDAVPRDRKNDAGRQKANPQSEKGGHGAPDTCQIAFHGKGETEFAEQMHSADSQNASGSRVRQRGVRGDNACGATQMLLVPVHIYGSDEQGLRTAHGGAVTNLSKPEALGAFHPPGSRHMQRS